MQKSFDALDVDPFFIKSLGARNIHEPTPIQEKVIPLLLQSKNLLFSSPTGTGKTLAYLLPLLGRIVNEGKPKTPVFLIAAPTYELCSQIKNEVDLLLAGTEHKSTLLIGQTNLTRQIESLKKDKPIVVIGNPGRLFLLAKMGKLVLRDLRFIILDEGDRLVSRELIEETCGLLDYVNHVLSPEKKAALLVAACSATFSAVSRKKLLPLLGEGALVLDSKGNVLRDLVEHWAIFSEDRRKAETLRSFIAAASPAKKSRKKAFKALVFTARAADLGNIVSRLQLSGIGVTGLMGDMKNTARKQALDDFRTGRVRLLVTSDLAARGLDIPDISHIIALDLGDDPDAYIHRAGRTGRAGKKGIMVTIGNENEMRRLAAMEKKLGIIVHPKELYGGKILGPETQ